jgi:hypothetical protein
MRFLALRFSYLDLVLQDTPIADHRVVSTISRLLDRRDLNERFERVEAFLDYLISEEAREYAAIASTSDSIPLRRKLIAEMLPEYHSEKAYIRKRTVERGRASGSEFTPYIVQESEDDEARSARTPDTTP